MKWVETETMDPTADDSVTVHMYRPGDYIIYCALIDSKKIGSLMRMLCDPVALCLIFVCLDPIFYAI